MVDTGDQARSSPTDLWGNPRDSHPDIGAFEFGFAAPDGGLGTWDGGSQPDAGATGGKSSGCGCSMFPLDLGLGLLAFALLVALWLGAKRRRW
jgi:hypothetical protein